MYKWDRMKLIKMSVGFWYDEDRVLVLYNILTIRFTSHHTDSSEINGGEHREKDFGGTEEANVLTTISLQTACLVYEIDLSSNPSDSSITCKSRSPKRVVSTLFSVSSSNSSHCFLYQSLWPETSNLLFSVKTYTLRKPFNHCPIRRPNHIVSIKVLPSSSSSGRTHRNPVRFPHRFHWSGGFGVKREKKMGVWIWVLVFGFVWGIGAHGLDRHPHTERISGELALK